jgi:hypothetical protein
VIHADSGTALPHAIAADLPQDGTRSAHRHPGDPTHADDNNRKSQSAIILDVENFEALFKSATPQRDKFLARLFGLFSEAAVRE